MVAPLNHLDRDLLPSIFFSIWTSPFRYIDIEYQYIDSFEKYWYQYGHFENIDKSILKNINIDKQGGQWSR